MASPKTLVSTAWLADHLGDPDLRVIDASWYMPGSGRDAHSEYEAGHIPGARFFDIDAVADHDTDLPHMAPPPEMFASRVRAMGIGDGSTVVVYDGSGLFSAARVWWTFRLMGKTDVAVLDGGLPKWRAEGRPVESRPPLAEGRHMTAVLQPGLVRDAIHVREASGSGSAQIVDARGAARFRGDQAEPRPGLRAGHIPGARNLPYTTLLNSDGTMKDPAAIRAAFTAAGVDLARPVITSCGSGVTAAILALALEHAGQHDWSVYDGSWAEWGSRPDLDIATGDA